MKLKKEKKTEENFKSKWDWNQHEKKKKEFEQLFDN